MFSIDQLTPFKQAAEEKIIHERERYNKVYKIIETYISAYNVKERNCIIIGGSTGIDLLLGNKKSLANYTYLLYSEQALIHANNLANKLDAEISKFEGAEKSWITTLKTILPNKKYQITVDERPLVDFYELKSITEESNIYGLVQPIEVWNFDKKLKFLALPLVFHLMDMYRTLYSPAEAGDWEMTLEYEKKIIEKLSAEQIKGAGEQPEISYQDRHSIIEALIKHFVIDNPCVVLIGEYALRVLVNAKIENTILQVIYAGQEQLTNKQLIEKLSPVIEKIISKSIKRNIRVEFSYGNVKVMQDSRLSRIAVKIYSENIEKKKEIMYIYNISYDLIPFNRLYMTKGLPSIQVGDPFVIMRFLLIEIWIIRWIASLGKIDSTFADKRMSSLVGKYLVLRKALGKIKHDGLKIFQKNYVGVYENELLAQKKLMQEAKKYGIYNPRNYLEKNGKYRSLDAKKSEKNEE
jgi:hypothetical protein